MSSPCSVNFDFLSVSEEFGADARLFGERNAWHKSAAYRGIASGAQRSPVQFLMGELPAMGRKPAAQLYECPGLQNVQSVPLRAPFEHPYRVGVNWALVTLRPTGAIFRHERQTITLPLVVAGLVDCHCHAVHSLQGSVVHHADHQSPVVRFCRHAPCDR
jgi:hypothetical protein